MTDEEKQKYSEEIEERTRLFYAKYTKVMEEILKELSVISPGGYVFGSQYGNLCLLPKENSGTERNRVIKKLHEMNDKEFRSFVEKTIIDLVKKVGVMV